MNIIADDFDRYFVEISGRKLPDVIDKGASEFRATIVVRTANRPEILNRCISAAVEGCDVTCKAHWIVLDDSSLSHQGSNREIADFWKTRGLNLCYVNADAERKIAESLSDAMLDKSFVRLITPSKMYPTERGRNFGLIAGLSLKADVLYFIDDDMVHRHDRTCFFHWCAENPVLDSFIAAPRKRGISDMSYIRRLITVLNHPDWPDYVSESAISAESKLWYSPDNPLWKVEEDGNNEGTDSTTGWKLLNGQLMALGNKGAEWFPFPSEYNSDLNWSFLQSSFKGTILLKVPSVNAQHLPPEIQHPTADAIVSELLGMAITRTLCKIKPRSEQTLAEDFTGVLEAEYTKELFLFLNAERIIRLRAKADVINHRRRIILSRIENIFTEVSEGLKSVDCQRVGSEWLKDFAFRCATFRQLQGNNMLELTIRRIFDSDSV